MISCSESLIVAESICSCSWGEEVDPTLAGLDTFNAFDGLRSLDGLEEEGLLEEALYLMSLLIRCNPLMLSQSMRMRWIRLRLLLGEVLGDKCPMNESIRREGEGEAVIVPSFPWSDCLE